MTIVVLVEGRTEYVFRTKVKQFLDERAAAENKPQVRLETRRIDIAHLDQQVALELSRQRVTAVIGMVDVYPNYHNAEEAKRALRSKVGVEWRFVPHAAQYDVEAWLIPYWDSICKRLKLQKARPQSNPEEIDNQNPPSKILKKLYRTAKPRREYIKQIEMGEILRDKDLLVSAKQCAELKSLLNTLLSLSDLKQI